MGERAYEAVGHVDPWPRQGEESGVGGRFEVVHSFVVSYVEIYMERVHDLLTPPKVI